MAVILESRSLSLGLRGGGGIGQEIGILGGINPTNAMESIARCLEPVIGILFRWEAHHKQKIAAFCPGPCPTWFPPTGPSPAQQYAA